MKNYNIKRWVCNECAWDWNTLAINSDEYSEECPACSSFNVKQSTVSTEDSFLGDIEEEFVEQLRTKNLNNILDVNY